MIIKKTNNPIIHIPRSFLEKIGEILVAIGVISSLVSLLSYWSVLPQKIPIHFDIFGKPNLFGEKSVLLILCIVVYLLILILTAITNYPHLLKYPYAVTENNIRDQYLYLRTFLIYLKLEIVCFFLYLQTTITLIALKLTESLGILFLPILFLTILITFIIYFHKAHQMK